MPTFMRMHVGTTKSLQNLNTLNDPYWEAVYLHEYVHFMQDVTTISGFANIGIITDYMRYVNNDVLTPGNPQGFQVPVLPVPNAPDNVATNLDLQDAYNGTGDEEDSITFTSHRTVQHTVSSSAGQLPLDLVEVTYLDGNGSAKSFEFGSLCVEESMAYIIERECYPTSPASPDLPYSSAERLVAHIHPAFASNRLNILALCDAALMHLHPGLVFYNTLLRIKNQNLVDTRPQDVYTIAGVTPAISGTIQAAGNHAINQLRGYFNDPLFQPIADWLERMIRAAVAARLANVTFPLDLAQGGVLGSNATLVQFMTSVGTPLVTNGKGEATLHDPSARANSTAHYSLIWAINQIHSIFWGLQRSCTMVGHCCAAKIKVDDRCSLEPWERATDKQLCPFATVWRHWGLTGYYPV